MYLSGVTVELLDSPTTTDSSGHYQFTGLSAGKYSVKFYRPAGYDFTTAEQIDNIVLASDEQNNSIDAGLRIDDGSGGSGGGSIGDFVWEDTDGDGIFDDGLEYGLSGVSVDLYGESDSSGGSGGGMTLLASTSSDSNGHYEFYNLAPNTYEVRFNKPQGQDFTTASVWPVTLAAGQQDLGVDAGLTPYHDGSGGSDEVSVAALDPATIHENSLEPGHFRVSRYGSDTSAALTVNYNISGSATPGMDHDLVSGSVTIPADVAYADIIVHAIDDTEGTEGDETIIITLSANSSYTIAEGEASISLLDDDKIPTVSVAATDADAAEAGQDPGTFTLTRTGATGQSLTVTYTIGGSATPKGQAGADHDVSASGTVSFPAGQSSTTLTITPINDSTYENPETVEISLSAAANYTLGTATANIVIRDNDGVLDLDVDSDNDNGFGAPERDENEDDIEDVEGDPVHPGKLIPANNDDKDNDGIPDFADGYGLNLTDMYPIQQIFAGDNPAERFAPLVLTIPSGSVDISQAIIRIGYSDSDPAGVTYNKNTNIFTPASGDLRLWTVSGDSGNGFGRSGNSIKASNPGNYVPSGDYTPTQLGLDPNATSDQILTFYVEGITVSTALADRLVHVSLDGEPAGIGNYTDSVRFTSVDHQGIRLQMPGGAYVPLNANNDNGSAVVNEIPAIRDWDATTPTMFMDADLQEVKIQSLGNSVPSALQLPGRYRLVLEQGSTDSLGMGRVRVWSDPNKTHEYTNGFVFTPQMPVPTSYYVEGMESTYGRFDANGVVIPDVALKLKFDWDIGGGSFVEIGDGT